MAYNDSGELPSDQKTYDLGRYSFDLKVQNTHEPGEPDVVSVFAICHGPDGTRETQAVDYPVGTTVENWRVEANEDTADVYVKTAGANVPIGNISYPFPYSTGGGSGYSKTGKAYAIYTAPYVVQQQTDEHHIQYCFASAEAGAVGHVQEKTESGRITDYDIPISSTATYNGKTVYYTLSSPEWTGYYMRGVGSMSPPSIDGSNPNWGGIAWRMVCGDPEEEQEKLVARFAIDLREADGGPDGDWDEPGDTGDPSYTLNVSVTGASSGSNNGTPLEPGQAGGYGNGGTGGNGGGGGAGASTVIIYEFATDKAGTVNQEATAQGPGTGGPGGKGGKGGDGCILIFY